ncbi:MAG: hypothetical protein U9P49_12025 [Thermodesulfobacteriota bacterium]|nr:hypothetical protein [Thermodesulfobacteriota bacterium]
MRKGLRFTIILAAVLLVLLALSPMTFAAPKGEPIVIGYADIYHFKAAIEKAGGTDDINKLIKAMEEVETTYSLGKMKYQTKKIKPFYHSRVRVDPNDPLNTTYAGYYYQPIVQFQKDGKIVYLWGSCKENEKFYKKFECFNPKNYIPPAKLRKE